MKESPKVLSKVAEKDDEGRNIVTVKSFYVRTMLRQYDKQLIAGRRINRYMGTSRAHDGEDSASSLSMKRQAMIERVSREIVENLIFVGSTNPIVQEIKEELEKELHQKLTFTFPAGMMDMQILKDTPNGPQPVSGAELGRILDKLWEITLDKVSATML